MHLWLNCKVKRVLSFQFWISSIQGSPSLPTERRVKQFENNETRWGGRDYKCPPLRCGWTGGRMNTREQVTKKIMPQRHLFKSPREIRLRVPSFYWHRNPSFRPEMPSLGHSWAFFEGRPQYKEPNGLLPPISSSNRVLFKWKVSRQVSKEQWFQFPSPLPRIRWNLRPPVRAHRRLAFQLYKINVIVKSKRTRKPQPTTQPPSISYVVLELKSNAKNPSWLGANNLFLGYNFADTLWSGSLLGMRLNSFVRLHLLWVPSCPSSGDRKEGPRPYGRTRQRGGQRKWLSCLFMPIFDGIVYTHLDSSLSYCSTHKLRDKSAQNLTVRSEVDLILYSVHQYSIQNLVGQAPNSE